MARKALRAASKKKQPAAVETSESIEEQTRIFLESGNQVDVIKSGISGQPSLAAAKPTELRTKAAGS